MIREKFFALTRSKVPIFLLHRAANIEFGIHGFDLDDLMTFVDRVQASGARIVSLAEIVQMSTDKRQPREPIVAFTVDDGYYDQATKLGSAFAERGLPLTIFLITDFLDGLDWPWDAKVAHAFAASKKTNACVSIGRIRFDFDLSTARRKTLSRREFQLICKSLSDSQLQEGITNLFEELEVELPQQPPPQYAAMSWAQARELESRGISFAPHSCTHRVLSNLSKEEVTRELSDSWQRLSAEMNNALKMIAWPIGQSEDFGEKERLIAKSLGYQAAIAARHQYTVISEQTDSFLLDRFGFGSDARADIEMGIVSGIRRMDFRFRQRSDLLRHSTSSSALGGMPTLPTNRIRRRVWAGSFLSNILALVGKYQRPSGDILRQTKRIVFVCQGNICRSPYAEILAKKMGLPALSCGVRATGTATANDIAARMAFGRGVDLSGHQSMNIDMLDFGPGDLLLGMEPSHLHNLRDIASQTGACVSLLGLWSSPPRPWIADPYGLAPRVFEKSFGEIEESLAHLENDLSHLNS